jgi:iron complex outermembrane recepter protein
MSIPWIAFVMAQASQPATVPTSQPPQEEVRKEPEPIYGTRPSRITPISEQDLVQAFTGIRPEIVIVRGRIEQSRQIPATIVTVDATRIQTADDIATAVPGVWMVNDQDPGTNILSIRGATTDRLQQASVAFVLDGVPLADTELFTPRLFDLARIEVLKGPQGALYGKNASGGVVAITTQGAYTDNYINELAMVQGRIGNGGLGELEFSGGAKLSETWAVRGAGIWSSADGWIKNTTLNKLVDSTNTRAIRLSAGGKALGFMVDLRTHYLEEDGGAAWASSNNVTGKNRGRLSGDVLINPIGDYEGEAARWWRQTSARVGRQFDDGRLDLLVARDSYQKRWTEELDYRPGALTFFGFPAFPNGIQPIAQPIDVRATTLQARWTSTLGADFEFQLGAFGQETDKDRVDDFGPLLFGFAPSAYATKSRQTAVFGGVEWEPVTNWKIEVQGRFDRDERSQTISNSKTGARIERREGTFERFQPRIATGYRFGDNIHAYASYGEAFRPGGFNPAPAATSIWKAAYRPEITASYEAGVKLRNLPLSGVLDFAIYANTVTDFQNYTFIDNQSVTLNVDEVLVKGFEVSGSFKPIDSLTLGVSYALTNSEIQRFIATDPLLGSPATRNYTGKAVPNAPRETGKVWAQHVFPFGQYEISLRADANYSGKTFYEIDNVLYSPARWWGDVNASVQRGDWTLSLKAENVADQRWAISAFGQGMTGLLAGLGPNGPFDTFTINRGRRVSLALRKDF